MSTNIDFTSQEFAIAAVINKHRALSGWAFLTRAETKPMVGAWIEVLDRHNVPFAHYNELYLRAVDLRARRLREGLFCDAFNAELMVSCWSELNREMRQKEVDARRSLPAAAVSQCPKCNNNSTGRMFLIDGSTGRVMGLGKKCDHVYETDEDEENAA